MKCINIILTAILFALFAKAFPLPGLDGDLNLPADFELKSLEQIVEERGFVFGTNGTIVSLPDGMGDVIKELEGNAGFNNLAKREEWSYTCSKRIGPNPLIYWLSAYIYVSDRLKRVPGNCHVDPNQGCTNCACTGGAAVKLCRGGTSAPDFRVPNGEVGYRASLVVNVFLLNLMGLARCGGSWPGCSDALNCQFEGLATYGGLSEDWYVYLTQERDIPKCIPI
ncbi:hypothetical protein TWF481_001663 [Arthrobotrys musiformis]|uniref:Uncharacterized protein n=1 Tax=Arthrobotrys musiformis TaxID=47236 RepID=A0AAV9VTY5_9PEZI